MTPNTISRGILRAVGILAGIILLLYFLYEIRSVIAYIAIAAVVALIGRPLTLFLRRRLKFPNTLAVVATMLLMVGVLAGIIALFVPLITEQSRNLSLLNIDELQSSLNRLYQEVILYLGATPEEVNQIIRESELGKNVMEGLDLAFIPNILNSFFSILSSVSLGLFSVLFISFFFLRDSKLFQTGLLVLIHMAP